MVDAGNRRVKKLSSDGAHIATFDTGALVGEVTPQVISLDPCGVFYLSHPSNTLVLAFDLEGRRLAALPEAGLQGTHDTAISPDGERLYVADTGNNLVKVYMVTRNYAASGQYGSPASHRLKHLFVLAPAGGD